MLRSARAAQAAFERARRANLPLSWGRSGGSARCDERIGRFCFWHDDGEATGDPPPEPPRIGQARARLIRTLDSTATLLPGDGWIAGQRVRYLVEDGRAAAALDVARACRASSPSPGWWCDALAGFALHAAGDFAGAEAAFRAALDAMPAEKRCRWSDLTLLLDDAAAARYGRLGCAQRQPVEARAWWLARPLFLLPGNDRLTEHYARRTMARLWEDALSAYNLRWGDDQAEIMIRFGWPVRWSEERPEIGRSLERVIVGHQRTPGFHFLPSARAVNDPTTGDSDDWDLAAARPRERYAPFYATAFGTVTHQIARFRRGASWLVVAAYDLEGDTLFAGRPIEAALALAQDTREPPVVQHLLRAPRRGVLVATASGSALLASVEILARADRRAARARSILRPAVAATRVSLSDLLVYDPPSPAHPPSSSDSVSGDLDAVIPRVRGSLTVPAGRRLGLFWELYGVDPGGEVVTFDLAVTRTGGSWLRRATESLGLSAPRAPVRLQWREVPEWSGPAAGRALTLDLTGVTPGRYRIALTVLAAGQSPTTISRELLIVGR
ncbi:MAG: hypothetical protein ACREL9_02435 [Gemmatimonadales bacterium]